MEIVIMINHKKSMINGKNQHQKILKTIYNHITIKFCEAINSTRKCEK